MFLFRLPLGSRQHHSSVEKPLGKHPLEYYLKGLFSVQIHIGLHAHRRSTSQLIGTREQHQLIDGVMPQQVLGMGTFEVLKEVLRRVLIT